MCHLVDEFELSQPTIGDPSNAPRRRTSLIGRTARHLDDRPRAAFLRLPVERRLGPDALVSEGGGRARGRRRARLDASGGLGGGRRHLTRKASRPGRDVRDRRADLARWARRPPLRAPPRRTARRRHRRLGGARARLRALRVRRRGRGQRLRRRARPGPRRRPSPSRARCVERAENAGIWTVQTGIFPENAASVQLHLRCGFRIVGRRERLAQLDGVWRDVLFLERRSAKV